MNEFRKKKTFFVVKQNHGIVTQKNQIKNEIDLYCGKVISINIDQHDQQALACNSRLVRL